MPIVGRDWSHSGVGEFFSKCRANNYEFLYLTARAIGQADATRDYLFSLNRQESVCCTRMLL
jgi:phosphatidate phosphatase LPIN